MAYVSLYRKYRSQTFGELVGQDHVVRALRNAIQSGRIAQTYLFTGPRGTGKTSTARLLAKALCAENGPTADFSEDDPIVREISAGSCIDVVEMDAASDAGVDDVRERIVEVAEYRPMVCRYKVFIIDEVHDLSPKAFDALLKTIEEPPPHLIFILATTEYSKVPPTIRSRCQKYEFHRASMGDLQARIGEVAEAEGFAIEPAAVDAIARMADGGYRDALSLLEQAIITSDDNRVTLRGVYDQLGMVPEESVDTLLTAMREADVPALVKGLDEIARMGRDPRATLESMLHRLSDLTRAAFELDFDTGTRQAASHELANRLGRDTILRLRSGLADTHKAIRDVTLPRLWLESELIRLSRALQAPAPGVAVAAPVESAALASAPADAPIRRRELKEPESVRKPVSAPSPEPEVAPVPSTPAPKSEPAPETPKRSGPMMIKTLGETWKDVLESLPPTTTIAKKLVDSTLREDEGMAVVTVGRRLDKEWLEADVRRLGHLKKALKERGYALDVRVEAQGKDASAVVEAPAAVELPAEGSRLEQLTREVFEIPDASGER